VSGLQGALGRAWALRGRDAEDVVADLVKTYDITAEEAQAAITVAEGFDVHPLVGQRGTQSDDGYRVVATSYADIEAQLTEWLWSQRIPRAALSLLVGTEGLGKTAFGLGLVAKLTRGELTGCFHGTPINVALFTPEDDASRTIKPRLIAAGATENRVFDIKMKKDATDRGFSLPGDTDLLIEAMVSNEIRFAFADPFASMLDPKVNSWKDTDIREALEPLVAAAAEHDITFLGSLHTNKTASTDARTRGMGSVGWRQISRAAFLVGLDPDDEDGAAGSKRCIAHDKHNLGPRTQTVRFALDTQSIGVQGTRQSTVRAVMGEECDVTAAQMLAAEQGHDKLETRAGDAESWLRGLLAEGPRAASVVRAAAGDAGHKWRTIERVKHDIGVCSKQTAAGWTWSMPTGIDF
jgi:AAA domain